MDIKEYIASGVLELYVYGSLSEKENLEVYEMLQKYPEIAIEVERIEKAMLQLSGATAPPLSDSLLSKIEDRLDNTNKAVIPITKKRNNWPAYIGWAASIALLIGLFTQLNKNRELRQQLVERQIEQRLLEGKINVVEEDLSKAKSMLSVLRNKDIIQIPLNPQQVDPSAYAAVYWDKNSKTTYIDVAGLPAPPSGKVYQVWSLTLNPLTPTSLGTLDQFTTDNTKIFTLSNPNNSEAFGITLEPEGGSTSPTMEMLYALGTVDS